MGGEGLGGGGFMLGLVLVWWGLFDGDLRGVLE